MSDKYDIDWQDTQALWKFSMESVRIAENYKDARARFGQALKFLKLKLAREYGAGRIERRIAEDKAYLILADTDEDCREALKVMITEENQYKGLEKVIEARQAAVSFNQSLIKNVRQST